MDPRSLEAIYRRHQQGLYSLALAITRQPEAAEDAVHEAFARLCALGASTQVDETVYVFASVRNAAVDHVRQRGDSAITPASIFNGHAPDPRDTELAAERERLLRRAVDELPEEQREAVVLRIYAGLTFEQMAQALGVPLPTVAARYRRALEKLKDRLQTEL